MKKPEEWEIINGFPDYEISNWGRIKSKKFVPGKILSPTKSSGHNKINLCKPKKFFRQRRKSFQFNVSRLVGEHFIHNPYNLPVIRFLDGNSENDYYENLYWAKNPNNCDINKIRGVFKGEDNGNSKITKEIVNKIRESALSYGQLSRKYGISASNVSRIINNQTWK